MKLSEVKKYDPGLATMKEACDFMGIHYITLWRLVKAGKIKVIDITNPGSKRPIYRIRPEDIQTYYDNLQDTPDGVESINK